MKCVFVCVLLFDNGSWNGCRMLCSALELKGKLWTNLRKVYVTFICDWYSLSFANRWQLLPNRRRWKNAQADKRILPHIWRCKWCEMCEYWADFYLVCILFTPHLRESLQFPPEKTLARAGVPSGTTDGPLLTIISSHTMLQEHKEPAGRGISSLLLSDQLKETHKQLRKSSLFYQSLLVASWELKDKGYCVPAADMHCISWLVIHPAVLLPGKLMLLPFGVFCPQCSGCHMYGLFHGLPVYQMEQLFSCTPILYICFSSSNQSLTHFHTFCYSFLKCLYASRM